MDPILRRPNPWETADEVLRAPTPEEWRARQDEDQARYLNRWQALEAQVPSIEDMMYGFGPGAGMAIAGKIPAMAGMIRMAGKEYPNALLHRAVGSGGVESGLRELDWWNKLFQKGQSTQKPTSPVTPSVLQTFESEPYGLLFNVNEPQQIKHAAPFDVSSRMKTQHATVEASKRAEEALHRILSKRPPGDFSDKSPKFRKYDTAAWKAHQAIIEKSRPFGELWTPGELYSQYKPREGLDLQDLFDLQRGHAEERMRRAYPESVHLWHSEVIPEVSRKDLAGVRLPLDRIPPPRFWENNPSLEGEDLVRALQDFAQANRVPIYRWNPVQTIGQEVQGLSDPFRGKWGYPPGRKDYITSSMLKKIFGISELP